MTQQMVLTYEDPNPFIKEYYTNSLRLVASLVIHSLRQASLLNKYSDLNNIPYEPLDKTSWLYYQQISDNYNTGIVVTSIDNVSIIPFTSFHLNNNPKTKAYYSIGSYALNELLINNKGKEIAIMSALYPVDIDTAIASADHTILAYDTSLVEPQEDNLIYELQTHINNFTARWYNQFYNTEGSFYYAAWIDQLLKSLFLEVLTIRLNNCKTSRAHSFHIRMYLSGYYDLDKYMDYMTKDQQLYFYRNIEYISRNTGKQLIFDQLKDVLLTSRYIPLSEISVRHVDELDEYYRPDLLIRYKPLNDVFDNGLEYTSYSSLIDKIGNLSPYNREWETRQGHTAVTGFKQSPSSVVQTKFLYSKVIDYSKADIYPLTESIYQHWGYLSRANAYKNNVVITITDVRDGKDYVLTPYQAFVYYNILMTIYTQRVGPNNAFILGQAAFKHVLKYDKNTIDLQDHKEHMLSLGMGFSEEEYYADKLIEIFNSYEFDFICTTEQQFYQFSSDVYRFNKQIKYLTYEISDSNLREIVSNMALSFFRVADINLVWSQVGITDINSFFTTSGLNPSLDIGQSTALLLMDEIFTKATGYYVDDTEKISSIQKAMISIFKKLSSYTVSFITESSDTDINIVEYPTVSISKNIVASGQAHVKADIGKVTMGSVDLIGGSKCVGSITELNASVGGTVTNQASGDIPVVDASYTLSADLGVASIPSFDVSVDYLARNDNISNNTFIIGYEYYLNLTQEQKDVIIASFS